MVVGLSLQGPDLVNACKNQPCPFNPCKHANGTDVDRSAQFNCRPRNPAHVSRAVNNIITQVASLPSVAAIPGITTALVELDLQRHAQNTSVTSTQIADVIIKTIQDLQKSPVEPQVVNNVARIVAAHINSVPTPHHQHHRPDTGEGFSYNPQNPLTWKPYQIKRAEQPLPRQILAGVGKRGQDHFKVAPMAPRATPRSSLAIAVDRAPLGKLLAAVTILLFLLLVGLPTLL